MLTVGHGVLPTDEFVSLLRGAGVEVLVDVRRHPGSRRNPQFNQGNLESTLPAAGIAYRWEGEALGGRRDPRPDSPHVALADDTFRAYADHMDSSEFREALRKLCGESRTVAVMCAEGDWRRCHRRYLADAAALLEDEHVAHLRHDASLEAHPIHPAARITSGRIRYDLSSQPRLDL